MLGMGLVNTWSALAGLRAVLGAFEATLFPGAAYLVSSLPPPKLRLTLCQIACWYPRHKMASRMTYFFQGALFVSSTSPLLSYGLSQMQGKGGYNGVS